MWFNKKYKERISHLEKVNIELARQLAQAKRDIEKEKEILRNEDNLMAALMREALGMQIDFSAASTDKCLPPHFLQELSEAERKNFIISMETIYADDKFQKVVRYMINLFATNAIYKYDKDEMRAGQIAVVAFRTFLKEFSDMHKEFLGYKQKEDEFDPLAIMPET